MHCLIHYCSLLCIDNFFTLLLITTPSLGLTLKILKSHHCFPQMQDEGTPFDEQTSGAAVHFIELVKLSQQHGCPLAYTLYGWNLVWSRENHALARLSTFNWYDFASMILSSFFTWALDNLWHSVGTSSSSCKKIQNETTCTEEHLNALYHD